MASPAVRLASAPAPLIGVGSAGLSVPLPRYLRAGYDLSRNLGTLRADQADWSHRLSAGIETPCRCAAVSLAVAVPLKDGHLLRAPSFAFILDLKNLGSLSTF